MSSYLGVPPQSGFITTAKQRITSSTNNYVDLDHSISSLADVIVFVNFVKQDYTNLTLTTSSRITLGATLVASDIVEIAYLGKAVATQTPDTGTVTNDMLAGSIANDKLAGSIANSKLANSSITLNGSAVSLGGSATVGGDNTPAFFAYADAPQTVSSSTNTLVTLDNESYDTDNAFASSRFTVPSGEAGKYFFHGQIDCHANNVSENSISNALLHKNGSVILESVVDFRNNQGRRVSVMATVILDLAVGDYIELYGNILDTSGSPTFYSTTNTFFTFLTGYKLIGV